MDGLCTYCNFCWNPSLAGKDELASAIPTKGSSIPTPTLAVSHAPTPALDIALSFNNELFKQFIKAYLETQVPNQI